MRFERAIALWDQYGAGIHTHKLEAALCKLGCLHLSRGQYAEAEERLQRVRTMSAAQRGLNPWRVESHYALAIVRCRQQRPDDARKLYKSGLQLERSLPEVASDVRDRREQLVRELQLIAPSTSPRKVLDLVNEFPITCVVQ
jgi:Flp pilus assembly protein TadD